MNLLWRFSGCAFKLAAVASLLILIFSAGRLITSNYQVRLLFAEIERANNVNRHLADDASQLRIDLARAEMPETIAARSAALGFIKPDLSNTGHIQVDPEVKKRMMEIDK